MKKIIVGVVSIAMALFMVSLMIARTGREIKSTFSDLTGGLDRTVTVYDYNGEAIKSWTGHFDVSESENEVYFDLNGKRVIIHGGIVINEEN